MKRTWKTGAAVILAGSMLAACSAKDDGGKQAGSEKMPLRIFIDAQNNAILPPEQDDFVKKTIEDKFNVKLQVEYMAPGDDYNKKINAYLTSNDPPDMWRDANGDGGQKYALDGLLGDMSKFVTPQLMPNYFKYWVDETTLQRYQVHNQFVRAPIPYNKEIYRSWYIRKDWLDKLNLQVPKTYDDYVKVLRAFTNEDPDGNGKKDTYGFSLSAGGDGIGLDWPEYRKNGLIFASFIENGAFKDMQTDPRMEGVLNDIGKLVGEGVVDPDWFLNKSTQHVDKAAQGKIGVVLGTTKDFAFDSNPQSLQSKSKAIFPNANWVPFTPFGDQPLQSGIAPANPFLFHKNIVEKNPDKVKRIVEILDWLASEEGFLLTHYGQDGKHYTRNGKTVTLKPDVIQDDIVKKGDWLTIWDFFTPNTPNAYGLTVVDPRQTDRDRDIMKTLAAIPTAPYVGTSLTPPAGFDLAAFRKRQRELQAKAVFEDKSGKNWPVYREELMTKYSGSKLFDAYAEQIKAAGVTK